MSKEKTSLAPIKIRNKDFFIADIVDASLKDDMGSMEHPLFSLKVGDRQVKNYEHNGFKVAIKPGSDGCATIHDKDVWIFAASQLVEAMNRGRDDLSPTVRFTAYDFLVTTNRGIGGKSYELMRAALQRLSGTRIETNITTGGKRSEGFGLIESWSVVQKGTDDRAVEIELTLPMWLFRSIEAKHILTISPDYFRLRKALDRRLYEIARKHCGRQEYWEIGLELLHKKSGSNSSLREFRRMVKELAEINDLPDYSVFFDQKKDAVLFALKKIF